MVSLTKRGRDTVYQAESPNMIHDPQIGKISVYFFLNLNCLFTSLINILAKPIFFLSRGGVGGGGGVLPYM